MPLIAVSAVLLPPASTGLVTLLAGIVYFADVFFGHHTTATPDTAIQLSLFATVAAVTAYFASRVSVMGAEREALAGELRQVRLEAADVLRNIPTGIVTIDGDGVLLYCNPAAEQIFGFRERDWRSRPIMPEFARIAPEFWAAVTATGPARRAGDAGRGDRTARRPHISDRRHHHHAGPGRRRPAARNGDLYRHFGFQTARRAASAGAAPRGGRGAVVESGARDQEPARLDSLIGRAAGPLHPHQSGRKILGGVDRPGKRSPVAPVVRVPRFLARARDRMPPARSASGGRRGHPAGAGTSRLPRRRGDHPGRGGHRDGGRRGLAAPGRVEPAPERRSGDGPRRPGGGADRSLVAAGLAGGRGDRQSRFAAGHRQWAGDPRARSRPAVRAVRHRSHGRDGPRARHRTARGRGAPRPGLGGHYRGPGDHVHRALPRRPPQRGGRLSTQPSILIVDDEQSILDTLRILLKNEGFEVVTAQGGKAGLEQLAASAPDIVLTDIKMPGVDGIEILAAVKAQDPEDAGGPHDGAGLAPERDPGRERGGFHYVQKPFSNDEIVAICRRAAEYADLKAENK